MQASTGGNPQPSIKSTHQGWLALTLLPVIIIALIIINLWLLQWTSQQGIATGYPHPTVHMSTLPVGTRSLQNVRFSAQGSGRNLTYNWSFTPNNNSNNSLFSTNTNENTTFAQGQSVVHQFSSSDSYTVKVSVSDPLGHSSSDTKTIDILPAPPVARFSVSTDSFLDTFSVSCDASSSTADPGTTIQNYTWDFGDGSTPETDYYGDDSHYYDKAGTYIITLVVTDATGQQSQAYKQTVVLSATSNN